MPKLTVTAWKWGPMFSALYVNRLRSMLERHLHCEHELVCVTDDARGIDGDVRIVALPETYRKTPRCRRRLQQHSKDFAAQLGARIFALDLDVVIVDDITPLVRRWEPLVCFHVDYANAYAGGCLLMDAGVLDGLWSLYHDDPVRFPKRVGGPTTSDQAMMNWYLRRHPHLTPATWTERDGIVLYFGTGYERWEHLGVGPRHRDLPPGTRIVLLGGADKPVMDEGRYEWVQAHWR